MTTETFEKGEKILKRIESLKQHLQIRSIEEPGKNIHFAPGGTGTINSFLPMSIEALQNKYRQTIQAEIVRLQDVFQNL